MNNLANSNKKGTDNDCYTLLCAGLSEEMKRCVDMILVHGKLIRYKGGFWAKEDAELSPLYNGGRIDCYYPKDHIGTNTIKALLKRGVLKPVKMAESKYGEYPVECALAKACT